MSAYDMTFSFGESDFGSVVKALAYPKQTIQRFDQLLGNNKLIGEKCVSSDVEVGLPGYTNHMQNG